VCQVPTSLAALLSLLRPCFTQPTFQTFGALVVGFVGRVRDCTVTGMLQAAGLAGEWHHSRAHDFFARRRWDPDQLGLVLADFLVSVFVKAGAPIRLAVDDTLFGRSGRRVWGAHYLHDGAQPEGSGRRTRWGNCWVVVVLVVELPCLGGRPVALPILFRLFRPKDDRHPERRSQPELARTLIDLILKRFPTRVVELVMDGAYATKAWRGLPDHVTVTTRMRANAAVFALAPPRTGKRGRPALKGARLASLAQLAASAVFEPITITAPDGRRPRRARLADQLPVVRAVPHAAGRAHADPKARPHRRLRRRARDIGFCSRPDAATARDRRELPGRVRQTRPASPAAGRLAVTERAARRAPPGGHAVALVQERARRRSTRSRSPWASSSSLLETLPSLPRSDQSRSLAAAPRRGLLATAIAAISTWKLSSSMRTRAPR
jgi:hypothetical protein